jgi:CTP:phosphocholine cytidylyltransferase-like protein
MNETHEYIVNIFNAKSGDQVCKFIQKALADLNTKEYFDELPEFYQNIEIENSKDIEMYFNKMKEDNSYEEFEEGKMRELFGLFSAASRRFLELR